MELPVGPAALSAEWLTLALQASGTIKRARVLSFNTQVLEADKSLTGQLARISLQYDIVDELAPNSLFAKFSAADPVIRARVNALGLYAREVQFYTKLAPHVSLRIPRCYASALDDQGVCVLLLEDLAPARSGDWAAGCTLEQAQLVVSQIAHFHATLWESPLLADVAPLFQWPTEFWQGWQEEYQASWAPFLTKVEAYVPSTFVGMGERIGRHYAALSLLLVEERPRTLVHLDLHPDNRFFMPPGSGDRLAVIDWQAAALGRGVYDVAFLLGTSLDPAIRRASELDLLHTYYAILVEHGVAGYSFDECLRDYQRAILHSLGRFVVNVGAGHSKQEQEAVARTIIAPRLMQAIADLKLDELLPA